MDANTIIGYVALTDKGKALGNKTSYVIAGSEENMKIYISKLTTRSIHVYKLREISFGEILERLRQGLSFVFDKKSYHRFLPLARQVGIELAEEKFPADSVQKLHFVDLGIPKS